MWVTPETFRLVRGELSFWNTHGESGALKRCAFCSACGARIYHAGVEPVDYLSIKGGSIDRISAFSPIAHIWMRSALPWIKLSAMPGQIFEKDAPDGDLLISLWQKQNATT